MQRRCFTAHRIPDEGDNVNARPRKRLSLSLLYHDKAFFVPARVHEEHACRTLPAIRQYCKIRARVTK